MTEQEIESEVQARVEFKMNEFLTCVKNRLGFKHKQAFDMSRESNYAWRAFEELSEMLKKEIVMPTPYDEMAKIRMWEAKNKAVENIMKSLDLRGRNEYQQKVNVIVSEVENAQRW